MFKLRPAVLSNARPLYSHCSQPRRPIRHNCSRNQSTTTTSTTASRSPVASLCSKPPGKKPIERIDDDVVNILAARIVRNPTLSDLVQWGAPPLPLRNLLRSANFTLKILPTRLAKRIQALRELPFIVTTNPNIAKIHQNYVHSLSTLLPWAERSKEVMEADEEAEFADIMSDLVETHSNTIPILARGFLEARRYIDPESITQFLDEHLRARIGTRLIAQQHLALHYASTEYADKPMPRAEKQYIGIIDTALRPASIVASCARSVEEICSLRYGVEPRIEVQGDLNCTLTQIPMHLDYIIMELLKNSVRAQIENKAEQEPIEVTIVAFPKDDKDMAKSDKSQQTAQQTKASLTQDPNTHVARVSSHAHDKFTSNTLKPSTTGVTIRIRDRGGGISPTNLANMWKYSFTTFSEDKIKEALYGASEDGGGPSDMSDLSNVPQLQLAGLGYGLPLGRAYAEYFGGGIKVQSLWGWGTDVYLTFGGIEWEGIEDSRE